MPLILHHKINESTFLGAWKIDETTENMRIQLYLDENDEKYFASFGNELRKKHWLSYRLILQELLKPKNIKIIYDKYGKPGMPDFKGYFSVSHSGDYSVAIVSNEIPVGIDIERIRERIVRVAERFLSTEEPGQIGDSDKLEKLHIYWGAKESLYKLHGKPDVDLQKDIRIEPFDYLCIGEGSCRARMDTTEGVGFYDIFYRKIEDYMMVWAVRHSLFAVRHSLISCRYFKRKAKSEKPNPKNRNK
jgi:4'-phosphopantetheinyl transferase